MAWGPDADKYNEYKNVTDDLRESCPESSEMLNTDETDSLISLEYQMDMTNCDTSKLRAFCDEYLTSLEFQPMVATCDGRTLPSNTTGELIQKPAVITFISYDIIDCVPKSCPSEYADWTIEDIKLSMDISTGANCTIELMEREGVEKESVTPVVDQENSAPMDPTPSAASQRTFTLCLLAATAPVTLLMMMW
ncbi:hypothetical protein FRACYDRAFT_250314 [Fragilariopsis cylindrus CCMP1102]|uniref:Uncharacterized protein n=1 Tax=Fragilariopsis cylindrus CCMP1102 TaxID=635003 RepID=A0A1E7ERC5_9STRA|nr:hypothetical protein FRACYDRAFT_250314 [Fragilariopsis cylindrus CCMP1102]|eukprot:OEU08093.1 hypothetical protein FRACYDRAFT_250314 [Fragilariopsis cylindrus CCMP1102]